jgi:hypothetical protein
MDKRKRVTRLRKAEEKEKEARKIRDEALFLKKEALEIKKKAQLIARPDKSDSEITHDARGKILPGVKLPGSGATKITFSLKRLVREKLEEIEPRNRKTFAELLVSKLIKKAIVDEDDASIKLIFNYLEGMPKQTMEGNIDIKTALVSFIGGTVQAEQLESGEKKQLEDRNNETDKDNGDSGTDRDKPSTD